MLDEIAQVPLAESPQASIYDPSLQERLGKSVFATNHISCLIQEFLLSTNEMSSDNLILPIEERDGDRIIYYQPEESVFFLRRSFVEIIGLIRDINIESESFDYCNFIVIKEPSVKGSKSFLKIREDLFLFLKNSAAYESVNEIEPSIPTRARKNIWLSPSYPRDLTFQEIIILENGDIALDYTIYSNQGDIIPSITVLEISGSYVRYKGYFAFDEKSYLVLQALDNEESQDINFRFGISPRTFFGLLNADFIRVLS